MTVRNLKTSDIPILQEYARQSGFEYPDFDDTHIEAFLVVADSEDRPVVACAAKRIIELYGYFDPDCSPSLRMKGLGMIHEGMADELRKLGYAQVNVSIPPSIAARFAKRLKRSFGWADHAWPSLFKNI